MPLFGFLYVGFSLFSSTLSPIAKACFLPWYIWHLWHMSQWYHELGFIKIEVKTCVNLPRTHILPTDSTHLLQLKVQVWMVTFSISCFLWTFPLLLSVPRVWLGLLAFWQLALGLPILHSSVLLAKETSGYKGELRCLSLLWNSWWVLVLSWNPSLGSD